MVKSSWVDEWYLVSDEKFSTNAMDTIRVIEDLSTFLTQPKVQTSELDFILSDEEESIDFNELPQDSLDPFSIQNESVQDHDENDPDHSNEDMKFF